MKIKCCFVTCVTEVFISTVLVSQKYQVVDGTVEPVHSVTVVIPSHLLVRGWMMNLLTGYLKLKLIPRVTKCIATPCVIPVTKYGKKEHFVQSAMEFLEDPNIKLSQVAGFARDSTMLNVLDWRSQQIGSYVQPVREELRRKQLQEVARRSPG